jgi:hypothetical protein
MKICYIIKTCDKYLDNRVVYQSNNSLQNINTNDIFYLTSKSDISRRHFGWNTDDSYRYLTLKLLHFLYHIDYDEYDYDWYVFIDDDTFVFTDRLAEFLSTLDSSVNYYIGKELDHIKKEFCLYMSGGAGYIMSKSLFILLKSHIKHNGIELSNKHWCEDLTVGLLIQELVHIHQNNIILLNDDRFHVGVHQNAEEIPSAITFHNVREEEQFNFYKTYL